MLVFKLKNASADTTIVPEPQPINTLNAYRVIPGQGRLMLKPSNLDRIKVNFHKN